MSKQDSLKIHQAKTMKDEAIVNLWNAFRDLCAIDAELLTDQDAELWSAVINHDAIQLRLSHPG